MHRVFRHPLVPGLMLASLASLAGCSNKDSLQSAIEQACGQKPQCIANATQLCADKGNNCSDADHIGMVLWQHNNHIPPQ